MPEKENVALFDMDGTLCDYDQGLFIELEKLRSPSEKPFEGPVRDNAPKYIKIRADLIKKDEEWWANLKKYKLGWDVLELAKEIGFRIMILTQGPRKNTSSWSGKKKWLDKNLGTDVDITITRDKGLVYGKILVDDFPEYAERWLKWRPRGLVIMPANEENKNYSHPNVIIYDGKNLDKIKMAMKKAFER